MSQIRITKTPQMEELLRSLQEEFTLMSEAEIIKMLLSKEYRRIQREKIYHLTSQEDQSLSVSIEQHKRGETFHGTAREVQAWLES